MAKIVIDISESVIEHIKDGSFGARIKDRASLIDAVMNGISLPDNATNGDVIKAICPMWINYHDTDVELIINNKDWNAPYNPHKAGNIEESDAEFICKIMSKTINKSISDNNFIGRC